MKLIMDNKYVMYCTGCGLCKSVLNTKFVQDEKGYPYPLLNDTDKDFCEKVCPVSGQAFSLQDDIIWGKNECVYLSWSTDDKVRNDASSGGVLTALSCYLLDEGVVDGIIHTKVSDDSPIHTMTVVSNCAEDTKACMGSRYTVSSPLSSILEVLDWDRKYAFVGKPCDVSALRMYMQHNKEVKECIKYLFSFFCAGMPSISANQTLLSRLGCDERSCDKLMYRGNGWPGYTTTIHNDSTVQMMTYDQSWGHILGRDIRKSCRFCMDGIGEMADISCGDAWFLTDDMKPNFTENAGRNVVFTRTKEGEYLFREAVKKGYICSKVYDNYEQELKYSQYFQKERKETMAPMILALKICGKTIPAYDMSKLCQFSRNVPLKLKAKRFLGTLKRIAKGKI